MTKIYKYFPQGILDVVFQRDGFCGLKCSYPKDYNDPFELFLAVDLTIQPRLLAFYSDVVQEIPQLPTTCFSKSPTVTPMWAHYGGNQTGFVLEFDADALKEWDTDLALTDVTYRNEPNDKLVGEIAYAAGTKKPRHSYFLMRHAFHAAYFTKLEQWSYEQECRLVASPDNIETINDCQVLFIPLKLVTSIVIGPNFPVDKVRDSKNLGEKNGFDWYQLSIGKSTSIPYMKNIDGKSFNFSDSSIVKASAICSNCEEPISDKSELCPWCNITESDKINAAHSNPLRIIDRYGGLEEYFRGADKIGK